MAEKRWYTTEEGLKIPDTYVNKHHLIYKRADYKSPIEKAYRGAGGFIVEITIDSHKDLHSETEPPIKPSPELMREIITNQRNKESLTPYERLDLTIDLLGDIVFLENRHSQTATFLLDKLKRQREYIEIGRVALIVPDIRPAVDLSNYFFSPESD
jgi:hypothetical protein